MLSIDTHVATARKNKTANQPFLFSCSAFDGAFSYKWDQYQIDYNQNVTQMDFINKVKHVRYVKLLNQNINNRNIIDSLSTKREDEVASQLIPTSFTDIHHSAHALR